jgi:hypothetical protein
VCQKAVDIASTGLVADAKPYRCIPVTDPVPVSCSPENPCQNKGACDVTAGVLTCNCQAGYTGKLCQDLDCSGCANDKTCSTPNAVISNDGTTVKQSCVCNSLSIKGDGCNIVESSGGKPSPIIPIPTGKVDGKASIIGAGTDVYSLTGGVLDAIRTKLFNGDPVVVDMHRLDVIDGKPKPGPLPPGEFPKITLCDPRFESTKEPNLYLVETNLKDSKTVCAGINVGTTVPPKTFSAPNCWTFPVCHASTYATGTPIGEASGATMLAASFVTLILGLFLL